MRACAPRGAGQTAAEYVGVLLVVSVIIAAVATTEVGHDITSALSDLVRDIAGGDTPQEVTSPRCGSSFAVAVALFVLPATAYGQATDTRNRALIVLDASKSMNKDAGNGGTRLDAAKQAVAEVVDRLPAGAPVGLRVYGAKVAETSREEACKDTELVFPVGPLDKEQLTGAVNALNGKGRTPIGNSLLATPDDLGSSEGRRSVILVSDGGDNCAPPDPCEAAREVARQGLELTISVVGLQVSERARRQLALHRERGRRLVLRRAGRG